MQRSSEIQFPNNIGADKFQTTLYISLPLRERKTHLEPLDKFD